MACLVLLSGIMASKSKVQPRNPSATPVEKPLLLVRLHAARLLQLHYSPVATHIQTSDRQVKEQDGDRGGPQPFRCRQGSSEFGMSARLPSVIADGDGI